MYKGPFDGESINAGLVSLDGKIQGLAKTGGNVKVGAGLEMRFAEGGRGTVLSIRWAEDEK